MTPRESWLAEREKILAILGYKPEPERAWWICLDTDTRRAILRKSGLKEDMAYAAWDALSDLARTELSSAYEKRHKTFNRLSREFALCTATH